MFSACGDDDEPEAPKTEDTTTGGDTTDDENTGGNDSEDDTTGDDTTGGETTETSFVGKYEVQGSSEYESIELSADGTYLIVMKDGAVEPSHAEEKPKYYYGRYKKVEEMLFELIGFGFMRYYDVPVIVIEVTKTGEEPESLNVTRLPEVEVSEDEDDIFGTWQCLGTTINIYEGGELVSSDPDVEFDRIPSEVFVSKAGTYAIHYTNKTMDVAEWKWKEKGKSFYYRWDPTDEWSEDYSASYVIDGNDAFVYEYDYRQDGSVIETVNHIKKI